MGEVRGYPPKNEIPVASSCHVEYVEGAQYLHEPLFLCKGYLAFPCSIEYSDSAVTKVIGSSDSQHSPRHGRTAAWLEVPLNCR